MDFSTVVAMLSATLLLCPELVSSQEGGSPHVMSLLV